MNAVPQRKVVVPSSPLRDVLSSWQSEWAQAAQLSMVRLISR